MQALRAFVYLWILSVAPQIAKPRGVTGDYVPGQLCSAQQRLAEGRVAVASEEVAAVLAEYSRHITDPSLSKPPASNLTVSHLEEECAGLLLSARAAAFAVNGRMAEAEIDAERSLAILEKRYPGDHPNIFSVLSPWLVSITLLSLPTYSTLTRGVSKAVAKGCKSAFSLLCWRS